MRLPLPKDTPARLLAAVLLWALSWSMHHSFGPTQPDPGALDPILAPIQYSARTDLSSAQWGTQPPTLPLGQAPAFLLLRNRPELVPQLSNLLASLLAPLLVLCTWPLFGGARACLAGGWVAVSTSCLLLGRSLDGANFYLPCALLGLGLLALLRSRLAALAAALSGFCQALACLFVPAHVLVLLLTGTWIWRRRDAGRVRQVLALAAAALLILIPAQWVAEGLARSSDEASAPRSIQTGFFILDLGDKLRFARAFAGEDPGAAVAPVLQVDRRDEQTIQHLQRGYLDGLWGLCTAPLRSLETISAGLLRGIRGCSHGLGAFAWPLGLSGWRGPDDMVYQTGWAWLWRLPLLLLAALGARTLLRREHAAPWLCWAAVLLLLQALRPGTVAEGAALSPLLAILLASSVPDHRTRLILGLTCLLALLPWQAHRAKQAPPRLYLDGSWVEGPAPTRSDWPRPQRVELLPGDN